MRRAAAAADGPTPWLHRAKQMLNESYRTAQGEEFDEQRWAVSHPTLTASFKARPDTPQWVRWMHWYRVQLGRSQIEHLTLAPTRDGRWQGGLRQVGSAGYRVMVEDDPVEALRRALGLGPVEAPAEPDFLA